MPSKPVIHEPNLSHIFNLFSLFLSYPSFSADYITKGGCINRKFHLLPSLSSCCSETQTLSEVHSIKPLHFLQHTYAALSSHAPIEGRNVCTPLFSISILSPYISCSINTYRGLTVRHSSDYLIRSSVVSDCLKPHELQHTRLPRPSPSPGVYSNSYPLSQWCHPTISSSVVPFSSYLQSFPASGSLLMS